MGSDCGKRSPRLVLGSYRNSACSLVELLARESALLNNVVDRRKPRWSVSAVITAAGTADELHLHFFQADRHSGLCCFDVPEAFVNIVERHVRRFPVGSF